jgi:hypothetical protein
MHMKNNNEISLAQRSIKRTKLEKFIAVILHPSLLAGRIMRALPFFPFTTRMYFDGFKKPGYAYGVYRAALLAASLGIPEISALEFGVAQGTGFKELNEIAREVEKIFPVKIKVVGFDIGTGLPPVIDYRDIPYYWKTGDFTLEGKKIEGVVYGDVANTVKDFNGPPVGFVSFDLDVYSSTRSSSSKRIIFLASIATLMTPREFSPIAMIILGSFSPYGNSMKKIRKKLLQ